MYPYSFLTVLIPLLHVSPAPPLVLEDKDILQIDASIIVGALIFLTVASVAIETQDTTLCSKLDIG